MQRYKLTTVHFKNNCILSFTCSPINFLNPRHRLVYTVACAAQSSLWLQLLFISWNIDTIGNKWTSLIVKGMAGTQDNHFIIDRQLSMSGQ